MASILLYTLQEVRRASADDECLELLSGGEALRVHVGSAHDACELLRAFHVVLGCDARNHGLLADLIDLSSEAPSHQREQPRVSAVSGVRRACTGAALAHASASAAVN